MRALILLLALFAVSPVAADQSAAPGLTFNATLGAVRAEARPGDLVTRQFQLTLDANQPRAQFKAHFEDWWRSEDGKESFYAPPGSIRRSCASWSSANPVESGVEAGATLSIRFTIAVPTEVAPGGYWCALTVDQVPDPTVTPGVGVRFLASISTGIFIDISPVTKSAEITDLRVTDGQALIGLRNTGNTPLPVEGRIEFLRAAGGIPVATVAVPRGTLLPEKVTTGMFGGPLPAAGDLPAGTYLVRAVMDIGADHYLGAEREMVVTRGVASHASASAR